MDGEAIRYGVVGLGRAGWDIHIKQLRDRGDTRVVAVADPMAERRQQAMDELGARAYESLPALLADDQVEVVVIATPSVSHAPDGLSALDAGKHVVLEKPMAMNVAEADQLVRAAQARQHKLFIHHQRRFSSEYTHLAQVVSSGQIGRVFHIRNYIHSFNRRTDWQCLAKYGGGQLNNTVSHYLDMVLPLLGAPVVKVMGDLQRIASPGDVEDHVKVLLRAANGCTADIEISSAESVTPELPRWILCGTCGTLTSDGTNSTINWFDPSVVPPATVIDGAVPGRQYISDNTGIQWQRSVVPSVGPDIGNFYDNVFGVIRRGQPQHVTPESVREVIRVIAEVRRDTAFDAKPNAG